MTRRSGFTLVELLVVVAIIGLLFALLLPTLSGLDVAQKETACQKNLKTMYEAFTAYTTANRGKYPAVVDHYYGSKFVGPYVTGDTWAGMPHVRQLKQSGAGVETFFCPFDSRYGNWDDWPMQTWQQPYRQHWGAKDTCYVYIGYALFFGRTYTHFTNGKAIAWDVGAPDDTPLVADNLHYRHEGYKHGWYHGGGSTDGLFNAAGNTLFKSGRIVHVPADGFDWDEPGLVRSNDRWWLALE